jgi:hypothetical protein
VEVIVIATVTAQLALAVDQIIVWWIFQRPGVAGLQVPIVAKVCFEMAIK